MEILKLEQKAYAGQKFTLHYMTNGYYDIVRTDFGFQIEYKQFDNPTEMSFEDCFFGEWLEEPVAFGAFESGQLLGYVEGTPERWNNRYRISNICVFQEGSRHRGTGSLLMERMLHEAEISGARMAVLETQSCNEHAIAFYRRNGFEVIGFDMYAYSNDDPERHEMRIEMGRKLI